MSTYTRGVLIFKWVIIKKNQDSNRYLHLRGPCNREVLVIPDLTFTDDAISRVSLVTGTVEASNSVGTDSISITVMTAISTLINI